MIRILIDELGDGQKDIFLKVDTIPTFAQIADLYYMTDFLCLVPDKLEKVSNHLAVQYINYVKNRVNNLGSSESFIIFDFSDQYIGGLFVSKSKKGLIKTSHGTTQDITGPEIDKRVLDRLLKERKPKFDRQGEWLISQESIFDGVDWSI